MTAANKTSSVYVKVNKSMKIVDGLDKNVTVEEVIRRLSNSCNCTKPQVLLEVWNGCSRLFQPHEKLLESLSKWGKQFRTINLVMMDREKYFNESSLGFDMKTEKVTRERRRSRHQKKNIFKISYKKLPIRTNQKLQKCLDREMKLKLQRLINETETQKLYLKELVNTRSLDTVKLMHPAMQAKYTSLSNDVVKLTQMNEELEKHKKELKNTLISRQHEIRSLQKSVEDSQRQVWATLSMSAIVCFMFAFQIMVEQQVLASQKESEIAAVEERLDDLEYRLKKQQKIIQLQSNKVSL